MRIKDIMSRDVLTVQRDASSENAWQLMKNKSIHHLIVMDGTNVVGIVSQRDLGGTQGPKGNVLPVFEVMSRGVVVAQPEMTISEAADLMRGCSVGCLPVLDETMALVGIVTITDLLELLVKYAR